MALVDKSVDACLAAIEIYNKPDFRYREETFSILMLNAWELLLKARVTKAGGGKTRAIEVWQPRTRPNGTKTTREYPKLNRSKNRMTIGLDRAIALVRELQSDSIDDRCVQNLNLLTEIRDNSVHLHNISPGLSQRIQEVGSAALRNYVIAAEQWFNVDLSDFNFYLMPLSFHSPTSVVESLRSERHPISVRNLLEHIANTEREHPSDEAADFNVTLQIQLRFVRTGSLDAIPVQITRDTAAVPVQVSEENIRRSFPWDFRTLVTHLRGRYRDFKQDTNFYRIKREIERTERFSKPRYLDPARPKSGKKTFYSPGILSEFDRHFTR